MEYSMQRKGSLHTLFHVTLLLGVIGGFIWSAIGPRDRFTWYLEVMPGVIGVAVVVAVYRRFRMTDLSYLAIAIPTVLLFIGGHYTYSEVPWFNWLRDEFHLSRNHYDRVGHFAQGFFPAIFVRELLLRTSPLRPGKWLFFLVTCLCLSIAAVYELAEWAVAILSGGKSTAFLGTQGDEWDAQWDMALALGGAIVSLLVFSRLHDRQLKENRSLKS